MVDICISGMPRARELMGPIDMILSLQQLMEKGLRPEKYHPHEAYVGNSAKQSDMYEIKRNYSLFFILYFLCLGVTLTWLKATRAEPNHVNVKDQCRTKFHQTTTPPTKVQQRPTTRHYSSILALLLPLQQEEARHKII